MSPCLQNPNHTRHLLPYSSISIPDDLDSAFALQPEIRRQAEGGQNGFSRQSHYNRHHVPQTAFLPAPLCLLHLFLLLASHHLSCCWSLSPPPKKEGDQGAVLLRSSVWPCWSAEGHKRPEWRLSPSLIMLEYLLSLLCSCLVC